MTSAWLAIMTAGYAWTAYQTIRHPINTGRDSLLAIALVGVLAGVGVTALSVSSSRVAAAWLALLGFCALACVVLSHRTLEMLAAGWVFLSAAAAGGRLRRVLRRPAEERFLEVMSVTVPLGLAGLALGALLLGLTRLLYAPTLLLASALLVLFDIRGLHARLQLASRDARTCLRLRSARLLLPWSALLAILVLCWAVSPEIQFDALNYHLPTPRDWLASGALVDTPHFWHSYQAHLGEMLLALPLAFAGPVAAKLFVFGIYLVVWAQTAEVARSVIGARGRFWAAALAASVPLVAWLGSTAYVDEIVAMFLLGGVLAFLRSGPNRDTGWIAVAGILLGGAVGTKLNAGVIAPVLALVLLVERRTRGRALTYLASVAAGSVPWYLLTWKWTGNPVFPLLNRLFPSPLFRTEAADFRIYGIGTSVSAWPRLPFALSFHGSKFGESCTNAALGATFSLLILTPLLLRRSARTAGVGTLLAVAGAFFASWGISAQEARLLVPIVPVAAVLIVGLTSLTGDGEISRRNRFAVTFLIAAQICAYPGLFWRIPDRVPFGVALGRERPMNFLERALPGFDAILEVNRRAVAGDRVAGAGVDGFRYYVAAPLETFGESLPLRNTVRGFEGARLARRLVLGGYAFLLVRRDVTPESELPGFARRIFLRRHAIRLISEGAISLYRVSLPEVSAPPADNLLSNPGFEALDRNRTPRGWEPFGSPSVRPGGSSHSGQVAVECTVTDGFYQRISIEGERNFVLGSFSRSDNAGGLARLQVNWLDHAGRLIHATIRVVGAGRAWAWQDIEVTAPVGAAFAQVYASAQTPTSVSIDDVWFGRYFPSR